MSGMLIVSKPIMFEEFTRLLFLISRSFCFFKGLCLAK